ncbi:MAG: L,D-transpeptidase [Candidatus Nanopelagicales bacterium]
MVPSRIPVLLAAGLTLGGAPAFADTVPDPALSPTPTVTPTPSPTPVPQVLPSGSATGMAQTVKTVEKVRVDITPGPGSFGVGQLITARFSAPVRMRAQAEAAMQVTSPDPLPPGSWGWIDSSTAVYRPKEFWPGKTRVDVELDLRKVTLNSDATTVWVGGKTTTRVHSFRTARSFVARIDANSHKMKVFRNGKLVKVFGVSLGKPGFLTRSGVKIITGEKYRWQRMTSAELGLINESYDLNVPYAVRITPSGEFVHGAPWAVSRIGAWNGSHGCTNLNVGPAKWFYNHVRAGDVTVTVNTGRPMETWNGAPGSYWNFTWKQWQAKSAL